MGELAREAGPQRYDPDEALTIPQCASLAGLHPQTVRKAIRDGELQAFRRSGHRDVRVRRADYLKWRYAEPAHDMPPERQVPERRAPERAPVVGSLADLRQIERGAA